MSNRPVNINRLKEKYDVAAKRYLTNTDPMQDNYLRAKAEFYERQLGIGLRIAKNSTIPEPINSLECE